ncbi:MAG: hypothetical protein D6776_06530 [Planctomycetota bacterium]|nr:MAG: hypothetical protein D6776_06530 [Planctomycetota bacterium]
MNKKIAILAAVVVAVIAVLALKTSRPDEQSPTAAAVPPAASEPRGELATPAHTVLLFADPREAESSCGCAEVVRIARAAGERPGVGFAEYDPRRADEQARRHRVRVSPTVLILGADGSEEERYEGESPAVVARLRYALGRLSDDGAATR